MIWETWVQSQVESYQKLKKLYLMPPYLTLSIIRFRSRASGAIQGKELCLLLHLDIVAIEKGAFRLPLTMLGQCFYHYYYYYGLFKTQTTDYLQRTNNKLGYQFKEKEILQNFLFFDISEN